MPVAQSEALRVVLLSEKEARILERWLTHMTDRTPIGREGNQYARLLGKVLDAAPLGVKSAVRLAATLQLREAPPKKRRAMAVTLPKILMEHLPDEVRKRGVTMADPIKMENTTRSQREQGGLCPVHGAELAEAPLERINGVDQKKCTAFGCDYLHPGRPLPSGHAGVSTSGEPY